MAYDGIISFRPDTKANWESYNPVLAQGEGAIETDTGNLKVGDGSSTYTSLPYYVQKNLPYDYDISSADQTHTLPKITGAPQEVEITWSGGDGTYSLTIYESDGTTALDYKGEGEGHIRIISDGSAWKVVDYEDKGDGYQKRNDWMKCWGIATSTVTTSSGPSGSIYYASLYSFTYKKPFITIETIVPICKHDSGVTWGEKVYTYTTTDCTVRIDGASSTSTAYPGYIIEGTWR